MAFEDPWVRVARRIGLEATYRDAWGTEREAPQEAIERVLAALGLGEDPVAAELRVRRESEARLVAPVVIGRSAILALPAERSGTIEIALQLEDGTAQNWTRDASQLPLLETIELAGEQFDRRSFDLPGDLPLGYHTLSVTFGELRAQARVIAAPAQCWQPWQQRDD